MHMADDEVTQLSQMAKLVGAFFPEKKNQLSKNLK